MNALLNVCSAFGLSGAAGLNAYIPLLTISIMQKCGVITLAKPYDIMGQWWVIILLGILLVVEILADKFPGVDHVNDVVHSFIRPTAGAIIFASQMGTITSVHPGVWLTIGLLLSGSVHAAKTVARPIVNVSTAGVGAPVVSTVENAVSTTVSVLSILAPIVGAILLVVFAWVMYVAFRRFFGGFRKGKKRLTPVVVEPATAGGASSLSSADTAPWAGGV